MLRCHTPSTRYSVFRLLPVLAGRRPISFFDSDCDHCQRMCSRAVQPCGGAPRCWRGWQARAQGGRPLAASAGGWRLQALAAAAACVLCPRQPCILSPACVCTIRQPAALAGLRGEPPNTPRTMCGGAGGGWARCQRAAALPVRPLAGAAHLRLLPVVPRGLSAAFVAGPASPAAGTRALSAVRGALAPAAAGDAQ